MNPHHSFESHVSEVEIRIDAPSLPELFAEAARALAEVMAGGRPPPPTDQADVVTLRAPDRDALMVDWLNEVLFRAERDRRLYADFSIEHLTDSELVASIRGAEVDDMRTVVKAATFHGLRITGSPGAYRANIVLDV